MGISWNDVIKIPSKDEIVDRFVGLLRLASFPVASWHSGSFQKHTVETESDLLSDVVAYIQQIAKAGFIKYAGDISDVWVDLCAENVFAEARKPAVFTQGTIQITDAGGIGPITFSSSSSFWVANGDKTLRFVNITPDDRILPLNGTVTLTIQAETAGTDWNVGVGAITELLTPQPGLTVSNPALPSGTWITQQGANVESNAALAQRCLDKWATLGSGSNEGAYRYHVTTVSPEITDAAVYSPGGGSVRVIVRGDSGPVSSTALGLAVAKVEEKRPLGVPDVVTSNVSVRTQVVAAALQLKLGADPAIAVAAAQSAVVQLQRGTKIGGRVSRERIIGALLVANVEDLTLSVPPDDFQLGINEMWVPSFAISAT